MFFYTHDVSLESILSLLLILCVDIFHIRGNGYLRVDNYLPPLVEMENHIRTHPCSVSLDCIAVCILNFALDIIMYSSGESLRREKFVQNSLAPVTLYLATVPQGSSKFICTLTGRITVLKKTLDPLLYFSITFSLLLVSLLHRLLQFCNILFQGIDNLTYTNIATLRKLFLSCLEHLPRFRLQLR